MKDTIEQVAAAFCDGCDELVPVTQLIEVNDEADRPKQLWLCPNCR